MSDKNPIIVMACIRLSQEISDYRARIYQNEQSLAKLIGEMGDWEHEKLKEYLDSSEDCADCATSTPVLKGIYWMGTSMRCPECHKKRMRGENGR